MVGRVTVLSEASRGSESLPWCSQGRWRVRLCGVRGEELDKLLEHAASAEGLADEDESPDVLGRATSFCATYTIWRWNPRPHHEGEAISRRPQAEEDTRGDAARGRGETVGFDGTIYFSTSARSDPDGGRSRVSRGPSAETRLHPAHITSSRDAGVREKGRADECSCPCSPGQTRTERPHSRVAGAWTRAELLQESPRHGVPTLSAPAATQLLRRSMKRNGPPVGLSRFSSSSAEGASNGPEWLGAPEPSAADAGGGYACRSRTPSSWLSDLSPVTGGTEAIRRAGASSPAAVMPLTKVLRMAIRRSAWACRRWGDRTPGASRRSSAEFGESERDGASRGRRCPRALPRDAAQARRDVKGNRFATGPHRKMAVRGYGGCAATMAGRLDDANGIAFGHARGPHSGRGWGGPADGGHARRGGPASAGAEKASWATR